MTITLSEDQRDTLLVTLGYATGAAIEEKDYRMAAGILGVSNAILIQIGGEPYNIPKEWQEGRAVNARIVD